MTSLTNAVFAAIGGGVISADSRTGLVELCGSRFGSGHIWQVLYSYWLVHERAWLKKCASGDRQSFIDQ